MRRLLALPCFVIAGWFFWQALRQPQRGVGTAALALGFGVAVVVGIVLARPRPPATP